YHVVAGRKLRELRHGRRIVLAAAAGRRLVSAGIGRLQQRDTKFPLGGGNLLRLRGQRRHSAIGRINDPRGAGAGALERHALRIGGAGDTGRSPVLRAPARFASVDEHRRSRFIQFSALGGGEKLLGSILGGPLQRRVGFVGPDAL